MVLIVVLLIAALVHARLRYPVTPGATSELILVYILAGYCGVQQIALGAGILLTGGRIMSHFGFQAGNQPIFLWVSFLLLGGGLMSMLAIWKRDSYLLAPVLMWSVFFAGATYGHIQLNEVNGTSATWASMAKIFASHGLISVLLIALYLVSRAYRAHRTTPSPLLSGSTSAS